MLGDTNLALQLLAELALATGEPDLAARLLASATQARQERGFGVPVLDRDRLTALRAAALVVTGEVPGWAEALDAQAGGSAR